MGWYSEWKNDGGYTFQREIQLCIVDESESRENIYKSHRLLYEERQSLHGTSVIGERAKLIFVNGSVLFNSAPKNISDIIELWEYLLENSMTGLIQYLLNH